MRSKINGGSKVTYFDTVTDLLAQVNAPCAVPDKLRSSVTGTVDFTGTATLADAVTLARRGWLDGNEAINKLRAHVERLLSGQIPVKRAQFRMRGKKIDIGRYMTGRPDVFIRREDTSVMRESHRPKVVRIVANLAASGAMSKETILRRGAAIVVLVDTLERRNVRCQVDLVWCSSNRLNGGDTLEYNVTIKLPGEAVALDKLAFFTAHASSLRRLFFALAEHEPDDIRGRFGMGKDKGGYGIPGVATDQGDIYLDRMLSTTDWSEGLTLAWLRKALLVQGIVLESEG